MHTQKVREVTNKLLDEFTVKFHRLHQMLFSAQNLSSMIIVVLIRLHLSDHHIVGCLDLIMQSSRDITNERNTSISHINQTSMKVITITPCT